MGQRKIHEIGVVDKGVYLKIIGGMIVWVGINSI